MDFATSDHYEILGVSRTASAAELAEAYKALARIHHPDKNLAARDQAEVRFKRLAEAYGVLRDPESRRAFDESGARPANMSYEEAERMWRGWGMGADDDEAQRRQEDQARRKGVALLLLALAVCAAPLQLRQQALALCLWLLPGFAVSAVGVALLSSREEQSKWLWWALLLLMASYGARRMIGVPPAPVEVPTATAVVGTPHSGELVLMEDGRLALASDPAAPLGEPGAGWQQRLVGDMTDTIKRGQEQVLMVFSREGCPWCDRLVPVLEKAIATRAAIENPGADGLASAPLRVFIYDADEFGPIVEKFQLQGFPSMLAFGGPGVKPRMAAGYLGDEDLAKFLGEAAHAQPEPEVAPKPKKRGLFGLR